MNIASAVGAVALALSAAPAVPQVLAPNSTIYSDGIPPVRYQGDTAAVVFFLDDVSVACGKSSNPNKVIIACAVGHKIAMPNPCKFADRDYYAKILCHEIAHVNQWPSTHGDFTEAKR